MSLNKKSDNLGEQALMEEYHQLKAKLADVHRYEKIKAQIAQLQELMETQDEELDEIIEIIALEGERKRQRCNSEEGPQILDENELGPMCSEERQVYSSMLEQDSYLSSGYDTISSGSDEDQLIEEIKKQANELLAKQEEIKEAQANQLKQLSKFKDLHSLQKQSKSTEKLIKSKENKKIISIDPLGYNHIEISVAEQSLDDQIQNLVGRANAGTGKDSKRSEKVAKKNQSRNDSEQRSNFDIFRDLCGPSFQNIRQLLESERFASRSNKNVLTINPLSAEQISFYRVQEAERYKSPQKPWVYLDEEGLTYIVGPVVKKNKNGAQTSLNNKPRDHPLLLQERPGIVTLLCLARDAASRLPDGIGTRADILELIKHSAWMKVDGMDMNNLNNIVSGALDRLHYEPDPCVKYDSERKLWIYLHKDRTLDYIDWVVPREPGQEVYMPNCMQNNSIPFRTLKE